MSVTVRFAPSPTGLLHVGNARIALVNRLLVNQKGGSYILRYDDTDRERSKPEFVAAIAEDLAWLGIEWDREEYQSRRLAQYDAAAEKLKAMGRLYACYETQEELEYKRKRQLARGLPPVYDREGLKLSPEQRAALEAEGRTPHWRFLLEPGQVEWQDCVRGPSHVDAASLSDPVLIRADGTYLYTLPSVVDDMEMGVTHVVRGEDHVTNTGPQIQLFQALGGRAPEVAHLPLMVDASGAGLSKRLGSLSLRDLRDQGIEPLALNSLLAKMGTSDAVELSPGLVSLAAEFDFAKMGRATPRFDPVELGHLNAALVHQLPYDPARMPGGEAFWLAVRGNLETVADAAQWLKVVEGPLSGVIQDAGFCTAAEALLPPEPWDETTWAAWTGAVKDATGAKGKALFLPLRLALTGLEHGPELKTLLPLIGRDRASRRLRGDAA